MSSGNGIAMSEVRPRVSSQDSRVQRGSFYLEFHVDVEIDIDEKLRNYVNSLDDFYKLYQVLVAIIRNDTFEESVKAMKIHKTLSNAIQNENKKMQQQIVAGAKKRKYITKQAEPLQEIQDLIEIKCGKYAEQYVIDGFSDLASEREDASPLHLASEIGSISIVNSILDCFKHYKQRMVNIRDSQGATAMFTLLLNLKFRNDNDMSKDDVNRMQIFKILMQNGGQLNNVNNNNENVFDCLKKQLPQPYRVLANNTREEKSVLSDSTNERGEMSNSRSKEIKMILKSALRLVIYDGQTAIRRCTNEIAIAKYQNFCKSLVNGYDASNPKNRKFIWKDFIYDEEKIYIERSKSILTFGQKVKIELPNTELDNDHPQHVTKYLGQVGTIVAIDSGISASIKFINKNNVNSHECEFELKYLKLQSKPGANQRKSSVKRYGLIRIFYIDLSKNLESKMPDERKYMPLKMVHVAVFPFLRYNSLLNTEGRWYVHENSDWLDAELYTTLEKKQKITQFQDGVNEKDDISHREWEERSHFDTSKATNGFKKTKDAIVDTTGQKVWELNNTLFFHSKSIVEKIKTTLNDISNIVDPFADFNKYMKEYHKKEQCFISFYDCYQQNGESTRYKFVQCEKNVPSKNPFYDSIIKSLDDDIKEMQQLFPPAKLSHEYYTDSRQFRDLFILLKIMLGDTWCSVSLLEEFKLYLNFASNINDETTDWFYLHHLALLKRFGTNESRVNKKSLTNGEHDSNTMAILSQHDDVAGIEKLMKAYFDFYNVCLNSFSICSHNCDGEYVHGRWIFTTEKTYDHTIKSATIDIKSRRDKTVSYFLKEIIASALNAQCGAEVCSLVDCKEADLLEALEVSPAINTVFGKDLHPSVTVVYNQLIFEATKYPNERKAKQLISILIKKGVDVCVKDSHNLTLIDYAVQRHMVDVCSQLIIAGSPLSAKSCEDLLNYLESLSFYYMKFHKNSKINPYVKIREEIRKQILFFGCEKGTLSSTVMLYLKEDAEMQQEEDRHLKSLRHSDRFLCQRDLHGRTAMHYASMHGHSHIIEALFINGAASCLNMPDDVSTPLFTASDINPI